MSTYDYSPKSKRSYDYAAYDLASLESRLIALFIDSIILGLLTGLLFAGFKNGGGAALGFLAGLVYQWYFLTQQNGQTPGKMMMGIRVVKTSGEPLVASDAILRYIGYSINSFVFMIGWLWALWDGERQGWHDKIASTIVVRTR
jgi:uncharacterized RDD family membrane protein YckC